MKLEGEEGVSACEWRGSEVRGRGGGSTTTSGAWGGRAVSEWQLLTLPLSLSFPSGIRLYSFSDLERLGFRYPAPHNPPDPDDIATFSYTSGTTGGPKVGDLGDLNPATHMWQCLERVSQSCLLRCASA